MCVIDGNLYAGTLNVLRGTQVWMYDGTTWGLINTPGFGDVNNEAIWDMLEAEFGGDRGLLVGTTNYVTGCELWFYNGVTWTALATGGFGSLSNTQASLAEFGGNYYAGTTNAATGTEVWRYDGTD